MERKVEALGPTGARVADRLTELRRARELTQGQLTEKLRELGRPIAVAALSKIEKGLRRVDTDDLIALALALDVSPNELLLPDQLRSGPEVELTPAKSMGVIDAWQWATHNPDDARGVFISYAHQDRHWAEWITWMLKNAGVSVFNDSDISPGANWRRVLESNLKSASCVIALLSSNYVSSDWASHEWMVAAAAGKRRLLPVRIEEFNMPRTFAQYQYVNLVSLPEGQARQQLLESVKLFGEHPQIARQYDVPRFPGA
ncbi:TIR domain-containing protein [Streptomyces tauricus]|uniref:TIR domain-containing protein n=1 Tax=Streptomyces tauricus TaxID=68274 RepID=UPI0033A57EBD